MEPKTLTERQAQIVEAALQILATQGARRLTANLLAKHVGLTGGALYRHFAGMAEIVDAIVDQAEVWLFEGFPPQAAEPLERLRLFFERRAQSLLLHPHLGRLLLSDLLAQAGSEAQAGRLTGFKRRTRAFVVGCLQEAKAAGALGEVSPEAGALVVMGAMMALSHTAAPGADEAVMARMIAEVWVGLEKMLRR